MERKACSVLQANMGREFKLQPAPILKELFQKK
jgi:hypothetical protein